MDVIPLIMSEKIAKTLPDEYLERLAVCSINVIMDKVKAYLTSPQADPVVVAKVRSAYAERLAMEEFLLDEDLQEKVEMIQGLDYIDISTHQSIEDLEKYKEAIDSILDSKYAIPYIAPIKGDIVKNLVEDITDFAKATSNAELENFAKVLKKRSVLFRDSHHDSHKGTILKRIIRNRSKYEIISKGIEFMLEKKRNNTNPMSWRYI